MCKLATKKGAKMKMTKRDIAGFLNIDYKTLYNWQKNKPNLYKTVMKGLAFDELIQKLEQDIKKLKNIENELLNFKNQKDSN